MIKNLIKESIYKKDNKNKQKAIFLDRDGTINKEIHYLHEPEKFEFILGVPEALSLLQEAGFELIIISNQGAIGKGLYNSKAADITNTYMQNLLEKHGVNLTAIYYCPHTVNDKCSCRKPNTGMIREAIIDYNVDINRSWMIGDKISDVEAGINSKLNSILVLTGYGKKEKLIIDSTKKYILNKLKNVAPSLLEAAQYIVESEKNSFNKSTVL